MAKTVYTRLLARAIEIEGSAQSLAVLSRVPEATLNRWRDGRALMPVKAFKRLLTYIEEAEQRGMSIALHAAQHVRSDTTERLTFPLAKVFARCARCDGI